MNRFFILFSCLAFTFLGCQKKDKPLPEKTWTVKIMSSATEINRNQIQTLLAQIEPGDDGLLNFVWKIKDSIIGSTQAIDFISLAEGSFTIEVQVMRNHRSVANHSLVLQVKSGSASLSPYLTRVFEFMPAPGQFVNQIPLYEPGDNATTMAMKAERAIAQNNRGMISLGGYGGYIVLGFDHTIVNVPDSADFKILGNAFWAAANPNPNAPGNGGSCEPGIVMVAVDINKNGLPDDPWYELAGSAYVQTNTIKNYQITYYKPDENKVRVADPKNPFLNDTSYVRWTTNGFGSGHVYRNTFHNQSYWPQWFSGNELKFTGTKLPNNYVDESGTGSYYVQYAFDWGYADNAPNQDEKSIFKIEWAVDHQGRPVHLAGIDFIKIYTGVNQYAGWLGETSTEVTGVTDLHLLK